MPDLLTHYATSYLVASRLANGRKKALLVAFFGLAPDLDVFFHVHRYISHSILFPIALAVAALTLHSPRWRKLLLTLSLLYTLHLALDVFTAPLPLFAPLSFTAYMVHFKVFGRVGNEISIEPVVEVEIVEHYSSAMAEGPIVSTTGAMFLVAVFFYELASMLKKS